MTDQFEMVDRLVAAVDSILAEPLSPEQLTHVQRSFLAILAHDPVKQVCAAVDALKSRGLGISGIKAGGLELACYQLPPKLPDGEKIKSDDDDPMFDAVR